ncbi:hypothetical protein SDRG_11454 [Saprolegnia diclina VS20]|uniref:TRP C-terminal domain-containing protein n=1 Tax=Saprolegnia diclina (strain VS20) TaxID=1156394 RepID=T0Q8N7_SAPDV|nr:hypothetical protein SDRG_11454 [Saprolegnia diclina VS20]EQC30981.1 hypothetical protein SDRG_11454 [Saprolegnia diclina VS20]|eukprot:XP_008615719.1 hypothetical protein SDRG_11454 [Saprolegnia diclina VS20]
MTTAPTNRTIAPDAEPTVPPTDHSNNINRGKSDVNDAPQTTVGAESTAHQTIRYLSSTVVAVTVATLVFFQFIAINPSYIAPDAAMERAFAPNAWELPTFVGFLQVIGALSLVRNANIPQLFYVNFLDSLSWINYLIRASAPSATSSTVSSIQLSPAVVGHRQLATIKSDYDASGYVSFSLRSHVSEKDWFFRLWIAVLVVLAIVLAAAVVVGVVGRLKSGRRNPFHSDSSGSHSSAQSLHSISQRLLGLCVSLFTLAYLPLGMIAMFEIRQDASLGDGFPHTNAVLSMVTLALLVALLVAGAVLVYKKTEAGLSKWQVRVIWGALYGQYEYSRRLFFVVPILVQLLSGVLVANVTASGAAPLIALIVLHALYIVLLLVLQPFRDVLQLWATVVLDVLLCAILGAAIGMTSTPLSVDTQTTLSYVIVVLVCVFVLGMLLRQLVMLWTFASGWAKPTNDDQYTGLYTANEHEMDTENGNYTVSLQGTSSHHTTPDRRTGDDDDYDVPNTIRLMDSRA